MTWIRNDSKSRGGGLNIFGAFPENPPPREIFISLHCKVGLNVEDEEREKYKIRSEQYDVCKIRGMQNIPRKSTSLYSFIKFHYLIRRHVTPIVTGFALYFQFFRAYNFFIKKHKHIERYRDYIKKRFKPRPFIIY